MELQKEQYEQIKECFPKQRKAAKISNLEVLNAVLYLVENGCKLEEPAQRIRGLARDLYPSKPLGEKGRSAKGVSSAAAIGNHSNPSQPGKFGFYLSGWLRRIEKKTALSPSGKHMVDGIPSFIWLPHLTGMG